MINRELKVEIETFYQETEKWNLQNSKMSHINHILNDLEEKFELLNASLKETKTSDKKKDIISILDDFLNRTNINQKRNKDYIWIIENAKNEISALQNNKDLCIQIALNKSHNIEKKLVNTFYLVAYTDNYSYNKIEPIVKIYDDFGTHDSISFVLGHLAYDSTACSSTQVRVVNKKGVFTDSTNCNWLSIRRVKGMNKFEGKFYYEMNGKAEIMSFEEEIYIK